MKTRVKAKIGRKWVEKSDVWVRLDILISLTRLAIKAARERHKEKMKILERMLDEFWTWRQAEVAKARVSTDSSEPEK